MKVEIIPAARESVVLADSTVTTGSPDQLENFNVWDDIDMVDSFIPPSYDPRFKTDNFKILDPRRPHTIYRDGRQLAKQMNSPWVDANPPSYSVVNELPKATTVIGWKVSNPQGGSSSRTVYGSIRVTWYVTFRGQKLV